MYESLSVLTPFFRSLDRLPYGAGMVSRPASRLKSAVPPARRQGPPRTFPFPVRPVH